MMSPLVGIAAFRSAIAGKNAANGSFRVRSSRDRAIKLELGKLAEDLRRLSKLLHESFQANDGLAESLHRIRGGLGRK